MNEAWPPGEPCFPRIAIFTHDTFGLGHVRRCLHILRSIADRAPQAGILFITGSPAVHVFRALPGNADWVKIPTIAKTGSKESQPPHLPIATAELRLLRQELIREALHYFAPDVLLVDNFPLGSQGELLASLQDMRRRPSTRVILGLRDILDHPDVVRADWSRQGIYDVLERYYDHILVYGMREVFDLEEAYALPKRIAAKIQYCGYVTATTPPPRSPVEVRAALGIDGPFLLATGGGGGDGFPLLKTLVRSMARLPRLPAVVFTGPLMSPSHRARLQVEAADNPRVVIREFDDDLRSYMAAADVVVSMCGYNIASEITALRARAIVVPRTWKYGEHIQRTAAGEEWEQMMRAQALSKMGLVELLEPEALAPELLAERITAMLERTDVKANGRVNVGGVDAAAARILAMASEARNLVHAD